MPAGADEEYDEYEEEYGEFEEGEEYDDEYYDEEYDGEEYEEGDEEAAAEEPAAESDGAQTPPPPPLNDHPVLGAAQGEQDEDESEEARRRHVRTFRVSQQLKMGRSATKHATVDTRSAVLVVSDGKSKSKSFPTGSIVRMTPTGAATLGIHIADASHNHQGRRKRFRFRNATERQSFVQAVHDANAAGGGGGDGSAAAAAAAAPDATNKAPAVDFLDRYNGRMQPAEAASGAAGSAGGIALLNGESVQLSVTGVGVLHDTVHGAELVRGSLQLTTYRVIFSTYRADELEMGGTEEGLQLQAELMLIDRLERPQREPLHVLVHTKNVRVLHLVLPSDDAFRQFTSTLVQFAFPIHDHSQARGASWSPQHMFFAFAYPKAGEDQGWGAYDFQFELERQRIRRDRAWRVVDNSGFDVSPTYPAQFVVPASISDSELRRVAAYRSRARVPALSWVHPSTKATLSRGAQPLTGVLAKRCAEDERLMAAFSAAGGAGLLFVDARGALAAGGNKAKGKGTENSTNYANSALHYCDIDNIHRVREAWNKVGALCRQPESSDGWLSQLERSRWPRLLSRIIAGAKLIVRSLQEGRSVLCHCSDGWDRTPQLTALALLMLDPYYRTLGGFQVLIEKEWVAFGHKFEHRCGHGCANHADEERSPCFVQFLDCVFQLCRQFPTAFEFNEALLLTVADHAYSCRYGNFLFNTERERTVYRVRASTVSLWADVNACGAMFTNPLFVGMPPDSPPLLPSDKLKHMRLWEAYFLRWDPFTPNPLVTYGSPAPPQQAAGATGAADNDGDAAAVRVAVRSASRAGRKSLLPSDLAFVSRPRASGVASRSASSASSSAMLSAMSGRAERDPVEVAESLREQNEALRARLGRADRELALLRAYADKMRALEAQLSSEPLQGQPRRQLSSRKGRVRRVPRASRASAV